MVDESTDGKNTNSWLISHKNLILVSISLLKRLLMRSYIYIYIYEQNNLFKETSINNTDCPCRNKDVRRAISVECSTWAISS